MAASVLVDCFEKNKTWNTLSVVNYDCVPWCLLSRFFINDFKLSFFLRYCKMKPQSTYRQKFAVWNLNTSTCGYSHSDITKTPPNYLDSRQQMSFSILFLFPLSGINNLYLNMNPNQNRCMYNKWCRLSIICYDLMHFLLSFSSLRNF